LTSGPLNVCYGRMYIASLQQSVQANAKTRVDILSLPV
jgi:hypothetical protein